MGSYVILQRVNEEWGLALAGTGLGEHRRGVNRGDVAVALEISGIECEDAFHRIDAHGGNEGAS